MSTTLAIYCSNVEDAAEIAEVLQVPFPRLFIIIGEDDTYNNNWIHPRDAVICLKPGVDGHKAAATRCALLFSPSYLTVFIDGTSPLDIAISDVHQLVTEGNQYGSASLNQHWSITKTHAVEYGFPNSTFVAPVAPDSPDLTVEDLVMLLVDLVPMFQVCIAPSVNELHKDFRLILDTHIISYDTQAPSTYFVGKESDVDTARSKIKMTGKVVCLNCGPEDYEREILYSNGFVRICQAKNVDDVV
jgi:hypothetical protein